MIHQLEVRFHAPLRGASLVNPDAPLRVVPPTPTVRPESPWKGELRQQLAEDRAAIDAALTRIEHVVRDLDERHRQRLAEWQHSAIELGVAIASRLLHEKVERNDMVIEAMVRDVVARLKPDEPITVRLHPDDVALLQKRLGDEPLFPNRVNVRVVSDPVLGRGDCRAEGKETSILSELPVQLAAMRERLLGSLGHAQSEP